MDGYEINRSYHEYSTSNRPILFPAAEDGCQLAWAENTQLVEWEYIIEALLKGGEGILDPSFRQKLQRTLTISLR